MSEICVYLISNYIEILFLRERFLGLVEYMANLNISLAVHFSLVEQCGATEVQRWCSGAMVGKWGCNGGATELQRWCNSGATVVKQWCNGGKMIAL